MLNIAQSGLFSRYNNDEISLAGRRGFLVIGDSIARGTNGSPFTGPGPTPTTGTAFYYRRSTDAINAIEANDLQFAAYPPVDGSPWPQFCIDYFAATGYKAVIIPTAKGSSNFADQGVADDCWDPTEASNLYDDAVIDANAAMLKIGITKLTAIFVVLGINDARGAVALGDINTAMGNFFSQIQIDFPDTDIVICQIGRSETTLVDSRIATVRGYIKDYALANDRVHLLGGLLSAPGNLQLSSDDIHLHQNGNNNLGSMFAKWMTRPYLSKWPRSIVASRYTVLSGFRESLISDFITDNFADWLEHDYLYVFKSSVISNTFLDWCFMCAPRNVNGTITADDCYVTNGTNAYFQTGYTPSVQNRNASVEDVFVSAKVKTATTAAGTAACITGATAGGTNAISTNQSVSSNLNYRVNDFTIKTYATDTKFQNETEYLIGRNGGTKYLYKNGSQVDSQAQASIANLSTEIYVGCINSGGTAATFHNGEYHYARGGVFSTIDQSAFYTALEYLVDHWND